MYVLCVCVCVCVRVGVRVGVCVCVCEQASTIEGYCVFVYISVWVCRVCVCVLFSSITYSG